MRLIRKLSHPDGATEVKLSVGTAEDLWHLYNLIIPGDAVRTKTRRKVARENAMGSLGSEMKMLVLEVGVQQINFTPEELRIQGVNQSENDHVKLGAHHTLTVRSFPPQEVTLIKKEWDSIAEARLNEACNQDLKGDTAAVLMNFGEAQVLMVTPSFVHMKAKIEVSIAKKHKNDGTARDKSITRFFKQVLDAIIAHIDFEKVKVVLLCSPGHVREEFNSYMKEQCQHVDQGPLKMLMKNQSKFMLVHVNSNTVGGLREAFSDPAVSMRMDATRCSNELRMWETFQNMMNNDPDRCVYTPQFVFHAAMAGAVGGLLISDAVFRSPNPVERRFYLVLVNFVKQTGAKVSVFSSNHVTGEQLAQLGNVACILHFPCPEIEEMEVLENFIDTDEVATFVREHGVSSVTL